MSLKQELLKNFGYDVGSLSKYASKEKTIRVPRKLKKEFKLLWKDKLGHKIFIKKDTISKSYKDHNNKIVWGCEIRPNK